MEICLEGLLGMASYCRVDLVTPMAYALDDEGEFVSLIIGQYLQLYLEKRSHLFGK